MADTKASVSHDFFIFYSSSTEGVLTDLVPGGQQQPLADNSLMVSVPGLITSMFHLLNVGIICRAQLLSKQNALLILKICKGRAQLSSMCQSFIVYRGISLVKYSSTFLNSLEIA